MLASSLHLKTLYQTTIEKKGCYFFLKDFKLRYLQFALILTFQLSPANGKDGVNGPNAQLRVAREPKSGLELAAKVMGHVKESPRTTKIAFW